MRIHVKMNEKIINRKYIVLFLVLITNSCDFVSVAEIIGTKTADMVKSFYFDECKIQIDKVKILSYKF